MFKRLLAGIISVTLAVGCFGASVTVGAAETEKLSAAAQEEVQLPFIDVEKGDWFYEAAAYNYMQDLITGVDLTHFAPYDLLTRAQFAVILYRMDGKKEVEYTDRFPDIPKETWYTDGVLWAADAGIVKGYETTGLYGPADKVTREQMAVMMYHYGVYKGYDTNVEANMDKFADASSVSAFAEKAMEWAVGSGIITGKNEGTILDPTGQANRAECATIIMHFLEKYKEPEIVRYTGYDGYIWNGPERTEEKNTDWYLDENVVESTVGIEGDMSRYFEGQYVDLSANHIALMANYMPNAKLTQYGGLTVTEITVYAKEEGILNIGTAKVSDVIEARRNGLDYAADVSEYDVVKGLNNIPLQIEVEENETIILGGNDSVGLYFVSGIPVDDENGVFATLDGKSHTDVINKTDDIKDKLDIQVKIELTGYEKRVFETFDQDFSGFSAASAPAVVSSMAPYAYTNKDLFENKVITKIGIPVKSVAAINANQVLTVSVIDNQTLSTTSEVYKLALPVEELGSSTTVGKFIYVDCEIPVGENQTLAFGAKSGDITWGYYSAKNDAAYAFYSKAGTSSVAADTRGNAIVFDVYASSGISYESHLKNLKEKEAQRAEELKYEKLIEKVSGKNFSILADSISTYRGYSNDAANTNSTIGSNAIWYPQNYLNNVQETWWMQLVNQTGMNLLVNNSWSASQVLETSSNNLARAGYNTRPLNLHDNTGVNAGTTPDIVAVFMGINDFDRYVTMGNYSVELHESLISSANYKTPTNFTEAYIIMLDKIYNEYDGVEVFCFTLLPNHERTDYAALEEFNETIRSIADYYDAGIVDLYYNSGITASNYRQYTGDGLHPNATGMDMLTDTFVQAMLDKYVDNVDK